MPFTLQFQLSFELHPVCSVPAPNAFHAKSSRDLGRSLKNNSVIENFLLLFLPLGGVLIRWGSVLQRPAVLPNPPFTRWGAPPTSREGKFFCGRPVKALWRPFLTCQTSPFFSFFPSLFPLFSPYQHLHLQLHDCVPPCSSLVGVEWGSAALHSLS